MWTPQGRKSIDRQEQFDQSSMSVEVGEWVPSISMHFTLLKET